MGQYSFVGIWYFNLPDTEFLSPQGSDYALSPSYKGKPQDPANCYNVYSTPIPDAFIFQSQLNGMYVGMPAGSTVVCAAIPDPAHAQPLILTPDNDYTVLSLPDKVHFMGLNDDGTRYVWLSDKEKYGEGDLHPTTWDFSDFGSGKGRGGFNFRYVRLPGKDFQLYPLDFIGVSFMGAILDGATFNGCYLTGTNFGACSLKKASLSGATCTGASFNDANLTGANLEEATLDGAPFYKATLTGANLSRSHLVATTFNKANLTGANLTGAKFDSTVLNQAILDEAEFSDVKLPDVQMLGASLKNTRFSNVTIEGGQFTDCDLRTVISKDVKCASTQSRPILFNGAKLNSSLLNHNWQWMDLRNATIDSQGHPLSSASSPLQATGAKLSGLNQNNLRGVTLEHAVLDYALLDKQDLSDANLTSASLIEASLHETTLTNVKLPHANLTGAQLGSLGHLFALPLSVESALNAGQVATLIPLFKQNNITLSADATLKTLAANRVWQLNDAGNHTTYTIRLETQTGNTEVLNVYAPAMAASMVNAYLPNAILTGVNLYGVLATGVQFYGSNAKIDGSAILEEAELDDANLSNLNLTQAQLLGTNLSGSYLFNAKFNKANLTPSANGIATNLSNANLQGADFTDAQLYGANLSNAAVAIKVPTQGNPKQGGVYLFSLPDKGDTHTAQTYISELTAAARKFSLNPKGDAATLQKYVKALGTNNLNLLKIPFLEQHPPIHLSNNAQIQMVEVGTVWEIVDGQASYTLWIDLDEIGNTELYAAPSLTITRAAFHQNDIKLRWQASVSVDKANQQWLLDNDSENPQNFSTGYVKFILKLEGSVLDVYGTALRIVRLGANNKEEYDTENCNVTALRVANMNGETVCPNGAKLSTNQNIGKAQWDERWLRAATPPAPPTCVPTNNSWCPQSSTMKKRGTAR